MKPKIIRGPRVREGSERAYGLSEGGEEYKPLLTMHGRFRRGKLERKRHMRMIQNVSLIEETIQRGVEGGRICWKNGEQVYLNEVLSTLDLRGKAM